MYFYFNGDYLFHGRLCYTVLRAPQAFTKVILVNQYLFYMQTNQHLDIQWNGRMQKYVFAPSDVKQGGVLSSILFGIHIDELLLRFIMCITGCWTR